MTSPLAYYLVSMIQNKLKDNNCQVTQIDTNLIKIRCPNKFEGITFSTLEEVYAFLCGMEWNTIRSKSFKRKKL